MFTQYVAPMKKKPAWVLSPIHKVVLSFIILIFAGTLLLMLPWSANRDVTFVDALFTSTSAVCVTGLTVLDTEKDFTMLGQLVIMLLIQFGGLGIMTFTVSLLSLAGGSFSIRWRLTFESFYNEMKVLHIRSVLKRIVLYTFSIELVIALFLFSQFSKDYGPAEAAWHSLFHAVSAFCNAGFSTFSPNIVPYYDNEVVILFLSLAIILGGLGFLVLTELFNARNLRKSRILTHFSLHTKLVLIATAGLLLVGTLAFLFLEWEHVMKGFSLKAKLLTAFFHSTSCRTAGFNSIDVGALRESTLFMMTALMFIGGSPGSIAGGIKTTTFMVILGLLFMRMTGRKQVTFWGRALDSDTVSRATTLIILSGIFLYFATFFLLAIHSFDLEHRLTAALFEVTSAFGTVGLSTGITPKMFDDGKLLVTLVMFVGRLGPLTLIASLTMNKKDIPIEYAEDHIMIG